MASQAARHAAYAELVAGLLRAMVEHALTVLPATVLGFEYSHREQLANAVDDQPSFAESVSDAETASVSDAMADPADEEIDLLEPPADLTARRLLVAGLTQLPEP